MKNLYLRDASVLIHKKEKIYSNNIERLKKCFSICNKLKISIQITIGKSFYLENTKKIDSIIIKNLKNIKNITIHLTTSYDYLFSSDLDTKRFTDLLQNLIKKCKNKIKGICIHPDHVRSWKFLKNLNNKKNYLAVEVTDKKARYGNKISHIKKLVKKNKFLKVVADTSHIKELEKHNLMSFGNFYKNFKTLCVEVQVSDFGNFYKDKYINTSHSLLNIKKDKRIFYQIKSLKRDLKNINIVIEGLVPYGKKGFLLLKKELKYINYI